MTSTPLVVLDYLVHIQLNKYSYTVYADWHLNVFLWVSQLQVQLGCTEIWLSVWQCLGEFLVFAILYLRLYLDHLYPVRTRSFVQKPWTDDIYPVNKNYVMVIKRMTSKLYPLTSFIFPNKCWHEHMFLKRCCIAWVSGRLDKVIFHPSAGRTEMKTWLQNSCTWCDTSPPNLFWLAVLYASLG